jgi:hypothetical protein
MLRALILGCALILPNTLAMILQGQDLDSRGLAAAIFERSSTIDSYHATCARIAESISSASQVFYRGMLVPFETHVANLLSVANIPNSRLAGVQRRCFSLGQLELSGIYVLGGAGNATGCWDNRRWSSTLHDVQSLSH